MYVLALVFALALQPVVNNGKAAVRTQPASQQPTQSPTPVDVERIAPPSADQGQTKADEHQGNSSDARYAVEIKQQPAPEDTPLFKWYLMATAAGIIVNAFIWFAILGQTKLNRQIAAGAETSANAAEKSANALIDIQRAWVNATVRGKNNAISPHVFTGNDGELHTLVDVFFVCRNYGFTPAWIYERHIKVEITNSVAAKPDLTGATLSCQIHPIAGDQEPAWHLDKLTGRGQSGPGKYALIYGLVKYRDIFGQHRETWFGYQISDGVLERMAHPEYNKNT